MEYIVRTAKRKLIITDQTSHLKKSLSSIKTKALNIENNILFNDNL